MNRPHKEIIGNSSALTTALDHLSQLATINRPVLIIGERGTGKELAAERLHFLSERWEQSLDKINCAAISDDLLESELFGHEPGAFTGATRTHRGRFERADGGTLFLDELGTMSLRVQEKLLRLVEYGEFERLGGQETLTVDVRVIAATNANLPQLAKEGKFRDDLLDRLSFDVVHLPPLRIRPDDISLLAEHFAMHMCRELSWDYFPGFDDAATDELMNYSWPGNIRELKNAVERSIYRWDNPEKPVEEIILDPFQSPYIAASIAGESSQFETITAPTKTPSTTQIRPSVEINTQSSELPANGNFSDWVKSYELDILKSTLDNNQGRQGKTADDLGLSYHQLRGLLRKHNLVKSRKK